LITDESRSVADNRRVVAAALSAGCRWVQLRHRTLGDRALFEFADALRHTTAEHGARLIVNGRLDVAIAVSADGLHLPASGIDPQDARGRVGDRMLVGRSVHSVEEILALSDSPLDYVQFGPVFETPSKREYGPPQGLELLARACTAGGKRPLCAVGGVTAATTTLLIENGVAAVAAIGAIYDSVDPGSAVAALLDALKPI
jgi:thiamine-phosphate pyrophosphorylase